MRIYIGPWQWRNVGGMSWNPPVEALSSLDLRTNSAIATRTTPQGQGLFVTDLAIATPGYTQIATDPNETLNTSRRNTIRNALGLPSAISSTRLVDIAYELMTLHSDIASGVICPTPLPSHRATLDFSFAGVTRSTPFSDTLPEWANIQKVLWANYRHYRDEQAAGRLPLDFHRRVLTVWMENYKISDFTKFIPSDLPKTETPLPHNTTHTENFDQADSSTVGPNLTWTELAGGNWTTVSNQLNYAHDGGVADGRIRADADVSSADHYAEIILVTRAQGSGICNRFSSSAQTFYQAWTFNDGNVYFSKVVTGTRTNLTSVAQAYSAPDTVRVSSSGSAHTVSWNGSAIITSFSDSSISTGTRGGVFAFAGADPTTFDDYVISDLAVGRTTKNTRENPLGIEVGMGWRMST